MRMPAVVILGVVFGTLVACAPNTEPRSQAPMPPPVAPPQPRAPLDSAGQSPLFRSERTLRLEVEAPLESVWRQRRTERSLLPARLVYENEGRPARRPAHARQTSRQVQGDERRLQVPAAGPALLPPGEREDRVCRPVHGQDGQSLPRFHRW